MGLTYSYPSSQTNRKFGVGEYTYDVTLNHCHAYWTMNLKFDWLWKNVKKLSSLNMVLEAKSHV